MSDSVTSLTELVSAEDELSDVLSSASRESELLELSAALESFAALDVSFVLEVSATLEVSASLEVSATLELSAALVTTSVWLELSTALESSVVLSSLFSHSGIAALYAASDCPSSCKPPRPNCLSCKRKCCR